MAQPTLEMSRCESCHAGFLPRPGACPRCGSLEISGIALPPQGTVLAATELTAPATGWTSPHRLALVEIAEGIRLLAVVAGPLPAIGAAVTITSEGGLYRLV